MSELLALIPPEGLKIAVTLFLSFLIGLEREEHKTSASYAFGGVRTFPLIALLGYALSLMAGGQPLLLGLGFAVLGGFMLLSFWHKLSTQASPGVTTEVSALLTFLLGALVQRDDLWIAATLVVISMLLLKLKTALENLSRRVSGDEILTFTKFLLLAVVVLPALPNQDFTSFRLNPYRTWLVVVAVSAVSYGGYVLRLLVGGRGGVAAAALLGGAYSSTVTTVTLAKRARGENRPHVFAGGILMASGMMYFRLIVLLGLFNRGLLARLGAEFAALGAGALLIGWLWSRRADPGRGKAGKDPLPKNPLELDAAFLFAALFVAILIATSLVVAHLGRAGVYGLAGVMGLTDVDPFIMSMTQSASASPELAAGAIAIAAASNNAVKGVYAFIFADRRTGVTSAVFLLALAALGLLPLARL